MPYDFFFSYTRGNSDKYLKRFIDDLSDELRQQRGYGKNEVVGFFDQREIELGEKWDQTIVNALQESNVMVCIYSPGYFKSEYCGKEWQVFQQRLNIYLKQREAGGEKNPTLPPVIKPIFWMDPLPKDLDEVVNSLQRTEGDPADHLNKLGLREIIQQIGKYRSKYLVFIKKLATEIREAADKYKLPQMNPLPALKDIPSAFAPKPVSEAPAPVVAQQGAQAMLVHKPQHVRFVFVAGNPQEFGNLRTATPYLETGGRDWRPFPGMGRIGPFVQHLVSDDEMGFDSDELKLTDNFNQEIEKAYNERKIVLILVDGWTLNWKSKYQEILKKFDQESKPYLINCSVLVPWNENDPDFVKQQKDIEQTLSSTFDIRANLWKNPILYRDSIRSAKDLSEAVRDVLTKIKMEMHKRAEVGKPVPSGIAKPVVSNQISSESNL